MRGRPLLNAVLPGKELRDGSFIEKFSGGPEFTGGN
jgi:hypothetical protein